MTKPRIAVTMGDPAGVGPEICLDLLHHKELAGTHTPIIFGDWSVLERCAKETGKPPPLRVIELDELETADAPAILDFQAIAPNAYLPGETNAATGAASYCYITSAIDAAVAGSVDAVATAPINKEALHAAGINFPGHTEIFASRTQAAHQCMMLTADTITCSLVTVHVGLHEVPDLLTTSRILEVIELTGQAMKRIRGREPKLIVCGLNPHAGEGGLFGKQEEEQTILPAIESARARGWQLEGPLPPDTAFTPARRAAADAYVCMYHDQGLIPLKALAFDDAIDVTLGLPIVRTSVDHGTALDIAWQGKANPNSLYEAVKLAGHLSKSS